MGARAAEAECSPQKHDVPPQAVALVVWRAMVAGAALGWGAGRPGRADVAGRPSPDELARRRFIGLLFHHCHHLHQHHHTLTSSHPHFAAPPPLVLCLLLRAQVRDTSPSSTP